MGEHSVLRGQAAMVCAISRRLKVELRPRLDRKVRLKSVLGEFETTLEELGEEEAFRFVLAAVRGRKKSLESGFDLSVKSEMSHQMGLGSSAAVTVATLGALDRAAGLSTPAEELLPEAVELIRRVQGGRGSGADAAASALGGVLLYRMEGCRAEKAAREPELTVLYSGSKKPTPEVIALVEEKLVRAPELFAGLDALSGRCAEEGFAAANEGDWVRLGERMNVNQGLLDAMGVDNARLAELVYALREDPGVTGSKISGSGLGDCVVGLGRALRKSWGAPCVELSVEREGLRVEDA